MSKHNAPSGAPSVTRTSCGLRDALFEEWDRLRTGKSNPRLAMAAAQIAKQIVNSVKIEIEFAAHVRTANPNDSVAMTTPLALGSSNAAPAAE